MTRPSFLSALLIFGFSGGCIITDGSDADSEASASRGMDTEPTATTAEDETGAEESGAGESDSGDSTGDTSTDPGPGTEDPAPECNEPGICSCENCPSSEAPADDILAGDATSWTFSGTVVDASGDGRFYIVGPQGQTFGGTIPTDDQGVFSFETPLFCGEQLVKCVWSNDAGQYALVTRVITEDCIEPDIRVGLTWTELGDDFELHLVRPGGQINTEDDCTWTTCVGSSPDWGEQGNPADDPRKDVDNTEAYGPENIVLADPEDGVYTVLVEHWSSGDDNAPGTVTFNVGGETTVVEIDALAPRHVWTAGTIEWPSGTVTTAQDVFDCNDSWSSGCTAELP